MIKTNKSYSNHLLHTIVYGTSIQKVEVMGWDIHWHSETKRNGIWKCDQAESFQLLKDKGNRPDMANFPNRSLDYWKFALLQPEVRQVFEAWGSDAHSEGYLTREDIKAKLEKLKVLKAQELISPSKDAEVINHHFTCLENTISNLNSDVPDSDQRIVFWFDS